jgi:hypothetical protein
MLERIDNFKDSEAIDHKLTRIEYLQGADPGIFVLAVHAFVEGWIRERFDYGMSDQSFRRLVQGFIDWRKAQPNEDTAAPARGFDSINALIDAHHDTDYVRHRFRDLARTDAELATQHLDAFCRLAGIGARERLDGIRRYIAAWESRRPLGALVEENASIRAMASKEAEERKKLAEQVAELRIRAAAVDGLEAALRVKERELADTAATSGLRNQRIDELRKERNALEYELKEARHKVEDLDEARLYVEALRRMTMFTRTRADYERAVVRLTDEQKTILSQIRLDKDFLVKGAAGTGKTLILLKAVEKAKGLGTGAASKQDTLELDELRGSVALLTYTTTLVKYDRFLSSLMSDGVFDAGDRIATADSFLRERLKALDPYAELDYAPQAFLDLAKRYPVNGLDARELAAEAENFIWANGIDMDEYVDRMIERKGMQKPLSKALRGEVWVAVEALALELEGSGRYTRNYAALKLSRAADLGRLPAPTVDYVFIDEAQDLPAVVLKALKDSARRCVLVAGDADQSIYQPGFSFRRSGLDLSGRVRILKTNFRNTVQVHRLAERYRQASSVSDPDNVPEAFREGPLPELFQAQDRAALLESLVQRARLFIEVLGYELQNIGILVPFNEDAAFIRERLAPLDMPLSNIRDPEFSFEAAGSIRVSTLHSAKGLDFPVVLLFLDRPPYFGSGYDEESLLRMTANIVYVAMTRAMDHLNVFTLEKPECQAIANLVGSFEEEAHGE